MAKKDKRKRAWMIAMGVIVIAILYFKFSGGPNQTLAPRHDIEKTGAGAVINFTGSTNKIHTAVDETLKKTGLSVRDIKETSKEVPRQKVEGLIRWHARQLLVNISGEMSTEMLEKALQSGVKSAGGQVISSQLDNYQGLSVVRMDIGLKDKVAGDDITIISDRVYLVKEKPTAIVAKKPEVAGHGQMAIIIDDFGYSKEPISAFTAIARPLTFAVLPYRPFSSEAAAKGLSSGHQVILHLPMEPLAQAEQSEKFTITISMSDGEIQEMTKKAIQAIPGLIGVNNHQGSRATADKRVMKVVLGELKASNLFFLDSRTNSQSIGTETARQMGIRTGENQLFIDNTDDVSAIKDKLRTAQDMAIKYGNVTVIGHARMNTATAVGEMVSELESKGIQLVFVSQMVK
ncbi:MAG: protein of unknown function YibQ [Firmicutes bacterium]|nr:protein of unknown function YibQ [Bacillota bacterium]